MILRRRRKRAGLFLSLALDSKEYKRERERERERVYFSSRTSSGMRRSFFKERLLPLKVGRHTMNGPSKLIPHHRVFKKSLPLFLRFKITHHTPSSVLLLLLLVIKKLLEFHISQILLYSILQNLQKSLLRLNRRVSRGVRRSSCCLIIRSKRE